MGICLEQIVIFAYKFQLGLIYVKVFFEKSVSVLQACLYCLQIFPALIGGNLGTYFRL